MSLFAPESLAMTNTADTTYTFQAEIQQLLHILVHSLYTERDIFLRELISNASDALNRMQFEMLTQDDVLDPDAELAIRITADKDAKTLTIAEGGVPRADIVSASVDFYNPATGDKVVPLQGTLAFTLTVENFGSVPIRTTGPNAGTHYRSDENFNTKAVYESSGAWRVGIDFEGNPSYAYPYRWSVGNVAELEKRIINGNEEYFLMPGQRAVVTGSIQIVDNPTDKDRVNFWAGLIHEHVSIDVFNDHVDPQPIVIGF
jgi:hypothetical protein